MMLLIRKILAVVFAYGRKLFRQQANNRSFYVSFSQAKEFPLTIELPSEVTSHINDIKVSDKASLNQNDLFEKDNATSKLLYKHLLSQYPFLTKTASKSVDKTLVDDKTSVRSHLELLDRFIENAKIPEPWRNAGLHYACYILDEDRWSAPSWIWTNAAIGRYYSSNGKRKELCDLADKFVNLQLESGGWVVRFDFKGANGKLSQTVAPNDSAYICSNTLLPAFTASGDEQYLNRSERCANWIMKYAHRDYLVHIGYELENKRWDTSANIVDIGFTADLFVKLYQITRRSAYLDFSERFIKAYINVFYKEGGRFSTAIDGEHSHRGTAIFPRGHAWALEGLMPYYNLTGDQRVKKVVDEVISLMLKLQRANGSWLHHYRPGILQLLSGEDCKGVPVLAHSLLRWAGCNSAFASDIEAAVQRSVNWCKQHTATSGAGVGGIFSWTPEGAFAGKNRTSAACVYANCYLGEIVRKSKELSGGRISIEL